MSRLRNRTNSSSVSQHQKWHLGGPSRTKDDDCHGECECVAKLTSMAQTIANIHCGKWPISYGRARSQERKCIKTPKGSNQGHCIQSTLTWPRRKIRTALRFARRRSVHSPHFFAGHWTRHNRRPDGHKFWPRPARERVSNHLSLVTL